MEPENWGYCSYWNYKPGVGNVTVAELWKKWKDVWGILTENKKKITEEK